MNTLSKIILSVIASCALISCSNDQYSVERQYYRAQKQADKIFRNPLSTPPNELQNAVNTFNSFTKEYPQTNLALQAEFVIARLFMAKEEYEKARAQLNKMIKDYAKFADVCSEASFLIAYTYEIANAWNQALEHYKKTISDYPTTRKSLEIPIYIARYYKTKFQPDKMLSAYREAISHYSALAKKYPNSLLALTAQNLTARCHLASGEWNQAIETFDAMLQKYKGTKLNMDGIMLQMALIYVKELHDKNKAKELMEALIKDYPRSRLIKITNKLLEEVNKK